LENRFYEPPVKVLAGITNKWQIKFLTKCNEKFSEKYCQFYDAQIQTEGGYNPLRIAEYAEGYCSWGMWQNNVCVHEHWSPETAEYIYLALTGDKGKQEQTRLKEFAHLLGGDWQIDELLRRYKYRVSRKAFINRNCRNQEILGERLNSELLCSLRLHNWGGGYDYLSRIVKKKIELYN